MPIEIKELHIRVTVNTSPGGAPAARSEDAAGGDEAKERIVAECVEQVLQILQNKMER
jgi:hypothetical protein